MNNKMQRYSFIAALLLVFSACDELSNAGIDEIDYNASYAIPLVETQITLKDFFTDAAGTDSALYVDGQGDMFLRYSAPQTFDNLNNPTALSGYVPRTEYDLGTEQLDMDFFESAVDGDINFEDPEIKIVIDNQVGYPMDLYLKSVIGNTTNGSQIVLTGSIVNSPITLNPATVSGEFVQTEILLNASNSNIKDFFNEFIETISLERSAVVNPNNDLGVVGFAPANAQVGNQSFLDIPVFGTAQNFQILQDIDVELEDVDNLTSATLNLTFDNGIPVDADVQVSFVDQNDQMIEELFDDANEPVILGASVDNLGVMISRTTHDMTVEFDEAMANKVLSSDTKKIEILIDVSTTGGGTVPVKLNENQDMKINISAVLTIEI